jgi:hypothetical protein
VRPATRADRRPLGVFLAVLLAGVALLVWVQARPAAEAAPRAGAAPAAGDVVPQPGSAPAPEAVPADGPVVPARIAIPAIEVDTVVESRGTVRYENPFTGEPVDGFGVPESMRTTSWWSDGPQPGSGQMAVVLGHAQDGGHAVFNRLHELAPGDRVTLTDRGGAVLTLEVIGAPLTGLDKSTADLADALNGHPADADVALVTCGGEFDEDAGASEDNTVVFATVVDQV